MAQSFGIMDEGYFVPRRQILKWVNGTLGLSLTQIEQLGSGSVYCQLLDALCPGTAPFHKINWKAKHEYEFIQNFKTLQSIFDRLGISKKIEVEKLTKCKYQDNLEFIQWIKRYIELQGGPEIGYDGPAHRRFVQPDLSFSQKKMSSMAFNKQNGKHRTSITSELNQSMNREQNQIITKTRPSRRTFSGLFPTSNRSRIKTQPVEDEKIDKIKQILKLTPLDSDQQLEKIRQILQIHKIEQEHELDFI